MIKAYKYYPAIIKDQRISEMLVNLSNFNEIDFNIQDAVVPVGDTIKLKDLDFYSRKAFPPCMKALFVTLKNQHHLKHYGRL
jgi:DNA primase large subunit